jgi:hypothetical protein
MAETAAQKKARLAKEAAYIKSLENPITSQYDPRIAANMGRSGTPGMTSGGAGDMPVDPAGPDNTGIAKGLREATNLGIGEALLDDPTYGGEIRKVFELYATNKVAAADLLFKTKWAKLDTDARDRYLMQLENSDLYKERLKSWLIGIKQSLAAKNLTVSDTDLANYYLKGIDNVTIVDEAISGLTTQSGDTATLINLRNIAEANGLNLDVDFAKEKDSWLQAITRGEDANKFYSLIRNKAGEGQSEFVKNLLKTGKDLEDIYKPYIDAMATTFGVATSTIKPNDLLLKDVFSEKGGISLEKFNSLLRKDSRYKGTKAEGGAADIRQQIMDIALSQGVTLSDADVEDIYDKSAVSSFATATIKSLIRAKLSYAPGQNLGGTSGDVLADLKVTAKANGLDFDSQFGNQAQEWLSKILQGESPEKFKNIIRQTAKTGYQNVSQVASLLDLGVDLETIYAPYRNVMASVLEINPQTIGLNDKTLRSAIGPDKEMTLYDWQRSLRKDPRWQYTNNAREDVSSSVLSVLRDFGFQG